MPGEMELREPAARAYMLREAAISAAELGEWGEAREWFAAARQAASNAASTDMKLMAIGLRADEAFAACQAGDVVAALNGLETALDEIAPGRSCKLHHGRISPPRHPSLYPMAVGQDYRNSGCRSRRSQ